MSNFNSFVFNPEQQKAIKYIKGPLLIIAGAGTGKTTVIVEKIQYLVTKKKVPPQEILALTFTEKAASEMEERVDKRVPYGYFQMQISTFHAFAENVLKNNISHIGISPNFKVMTEAESVIFLRKHLFLFDLKYFRPLGNPHKFIENLLQHFSRLKDEDVSPSQYMEWAKNQKSSLLPTESGFEGQAKLKIKNEESKIEVQKNLELAKAYETYQVLKIKEGVLDFADLVYNCLILFRKRKNILSQYQKQFRYILIDEFQDTNICQYELIKLLCPARYKPHLTVVGDDSQAIYKFRGASVSNILSFMHDYSRAKQVTLTKNYRSNQEILDVAYQLIKHNDPDTLEAKRGISKKLIAVNKSISKDPINMFLGDDVGQEAEFVANQIIKLIAKGYKYSDLALLVRANNHTEPFIRSFSRKNIPYQFLGPSTLFKQPEVKELMAYLKILSDPEDSVSLYRVLLMDIFKLDSLDIIRLLAFARKINQPLLQTIEIFLSFSYPEFTKNEFENYKAYLPLLNQLTKEKLKKIYSMYVKHIRLTKKESSGQILYYFLEETGYLKNIIAYKTEKDEKIALNISRFFNVLKIYEMEHEDASIYTIVDYLDMSMELNESPKAEVIDKNKYDAVNVLTVHSAKGLEFDVVFLANLSKSRFPTSERREAIPIPEQLIKETLPVGDYHLEEERRLFYVALTRAKKQIFLTTAKYYGEGKREQRISPFVGEAMGENWLKQIIVKTEESKKQLSIFDYKKQTGLKNDKKIDSPIVIVKENIVLSYSQIDTYNLCPLKYKYQYIIRVPTTPSASLTFGDGIHKTLQIFYEKFDKNNQADLKDLLQIYSACWIPIGYNSSEHERRMKYEGKIMLTNFYKNFHNQNIRSIALEKKFVLRLTPFISLVGKIDRIDKISKDKVEIIDYKTGKEMQAKDLKKNLQSSIYTLAASDKKLYGYSLKNISVSFYFLQPMKKITIQRSEEELDNAKKIIKQTVESIQNKIFDANVGPWCDFCPFRMICEAWQ